jgi:hypothetical protein
VIGEHIRDLQLVIRSKCHLYIKQRKDVNCGNNVISSILDHPAN